MDEQQVRLLVRQAIARHLGSPAVPTTTPTLAPAAVLPAPAASSAAGHLSFARFHLVRPGNETDCLIEPSVTCNHCGHCQCYGH